MKISMALDALNDIASNIQNCDFETKLGLYAFFRSISDDLISASKEIGPYALTKENLLKFKFSLEAMCGLSEGNNRLPEEHIGWMIEAVSGLRSDMCLGKVLDRPE